MAKKLMSFKTKGMNQDLSVSAFNPEFAFENMNLRLSTVEGNTMMSWVNEKGTSPIFLYLYECWVKYYNEEIRELLFVEPENTEGWTHYPEGDLLASNVRSQFILGSPLGTAILNHQIVLFTCGSTTEEENGNIYPDHIYLLKWLDASEHKVVCKCLYRGNLNFENAHPIETLVSYENELIQKVYWTDGKNQPRVINIVGDIKPNLDTQFDFIPILQLDEKVTIQKEIGGGGSFPPGVIQYCFTYYNKYMQESNIFYTSPLFYVSHAERGGSPEETSIDNVFNITINNVDTNFDYVRVYSLQRTSLNTTPIVKRVTDIEIPKGENNSSVSISYTDTGTNGDSIDPTELLYKGGLPIKCKTIEQKDSTLFLGNIQLQTTSIEEFKTDLESITVDNHFTVTENEESTIYPVYRKLDTYIEDSEFSNDPAKYVNELTCGVKHTDISNITEADNMVEVGHKGVMCSYFNDYNYYRLGVQFQHKTGAWSEPYYIGDKQIIYNENDVSRFSTPYTKLTFFGIIPDAVVENLYNAGFRKARAVFVYPKIYDRAMLHQGVVNPTLYYPSDRTRNITYAQASWFFRPISHILALYLHSYLDGSQGTDCLYSNHTAEERAIANTVKALNSNIKVPLYSPNFLGASSLSEHEGKLYEPTGLMNHIEIQKDHPSYGADWETVTFHTPDIELDENNWSLKYLNTFCRHVGIANFNYTYSNIDIQTETPTHDSKKAGNDRYKNTAIKGVESFGIGSGLWYEDTGVYDLSSTDISGTFDSIQENDKCVSSWLVYPWNREGSLNNDFNRPEGRGTQTSKLKKKVIANLRSAYTEYTTSAEEIQFKRIPTLFSSDQNIIEKIGNDYKVYRGNIDTLITNKNTLGNYCGNLYDSNLSHFTAPSSEDLTNALNAAQLLYAYTNHSWYNDDAERFESNLFSIYTGTTVIWEGDMSGGYWHEGLPDNNILKNRCIDTGSKLLTWLNNSSDTILPTIPNDIKTTLRNYATALNNLVFYWSPPNFRITNNNTDISIKGLIYLLEQALTYYSSYLNYWGKADSEGTMVSQNYGPWVGTSTHLGDYYFDLRSRKSTVRIKYKSSPHLVFSINSRLLEYDNEVYDSLWKFIPQTEHCLPIVNIENDVNTNLIYGGQSEDALKANIWIPCGEPVTLKPTIENNEEVFKDTYFYYLYGDTYYQRYDCLKTYPFTEEDVNQIVEIGSFMLETYLNIDGRYDRNRGQQNNLNMRPTNFNKINPVYSQQNNFFVYRIQDSDYYTNNKYPNQITWSKTKASGDETDMWTNVTMANTLEMDGDKGEVTKLVRLNDQLLCFQDTCIAQILYNDNVQIASTTGVPIEIANSQKVQGKRYLSNTIGCSNKWSMASTPAGIYFMDNVNKSIMMFNGQLNNLSQTGGFNSWCKKNILNTNGMWTPTNFNGDFVSYYDTINQDILFIGGDRALAFSEKFGTFTSFYDYGNTPYFCNLDGKGIWFKSLGNDITGFTTGLWQHQAGKYCDFFSTPGNPNYCSYWMTLVGNPEPQTDKIFTNLEFRASIIGDGIPSEEKDTDDNPIKVTPFLPFDSLEVWDEYQHGYASLNNLTGHAAYTHGNEASSLKRKFRMWRCDIPRNNCLLDDKRPTPDTLVYSKDSDLSISRHVRKPMDRMRNPWLYLKLTKKTDGNNSYRTELHDFVMTYFN